MPILCKRQHASLLRNIILRVYRQQFPADELASEENAERTEGLVYGGVCYETKELYSPVLAKDMSLELCD